MQNFILAVDIPVFLHLKALRQELATADPSRAEDAYAVAVLGLGMDTTPQLLVSHFVDHADAQASALRQFNKGASKGTKYAQCLVYGPCKDPQCECGGRLRFLSVFYQLA